MPHEGALIPRASFNHHIVQIPVLNARLIYFPLPLLHSVVSSGLGYVWICSLGLFVNLAPKLNTRMKPTEKTSITKKRKRAQPPPDLVSSEDDSGPQLQDLMDALAIITMCLSATEQMLATATRLAHEVSPSPDQTTGAD